MLIIQTQLLGRAVFMFKFKSKVQIQFQARASLVSAETVQLQGRVYVPEFNTY